MPAPAAPSSFAATQATSGKPVITLAWQHGGVDLDRFELLKRLSGETDWQSYLVAPKAQFNPAGSAYSIVVGSIKNMQWAVRAIAADGSVST